MILILKKLLKWVPFTIGAAIFINGIALLFVSNINLGNFLTVLLGAGIMLAALLFKKIGKILKILIIVAICIVTLFSSFLILHGKNDTVSYTEDAIIVLGAAVHGDTPSLSLRKRLDAAVEYHTQNPDAIIVVSGGKGQGENVTEAEAMEKYLLEKGVSAKVIIKESEATSTYENFLFSLDIIEQRLGANAKIAYITNDYHVYRAGLCAKQAGIENATHMHADTSLSYLISGVLRENLAVVKYTVFKS